jgi:Domain of unknown function (DUF4920)
MKKLLLLSAIATIFVSVATTFTACGSGKAQAAADGKHFGTKIDAKNAMPVADLYSKMQGKTLLENVKIEGKATSVCQAKGCWMKLEATPDMMVKFKDYAFFMPKDLAGKKVVCVGKAMRKVTPVDELRHYAEDAGKSAAEIAKITQPKEEITFEASGVVIE